jgi:bacillithiol system protein YtxJ
MKTLKEPADFENLLKEPQVLIFKHSTRCPVSSAAYREIEQLRREEPDLPVCLVRVIEERDLSRHISSALQIRHESPQVLLLRSGTVVWHGSHADVQSDKIRELLAETQPKPSSPEAVREG